jgi:hypothetical protein
MTMPEDPRNWSDEGASLEAAKAAEPDRVSNRERVLAALREHPQTTAQLSSSVFGTEGIRRLRELEQIGYEISRRKLPKSTQWEYTLLSEPDIKRSLPSIKSHSKFLCYVRTNSRVDAEIVQNLPKVYSFLRRNWLREDPPTPEEWIDFTSEILNPPVTWGGGTRRLRWDFEPGMLLVEHLYHV